MSLKRKRADESCIHSCDGITVWPTSLHVPELLKMICAYLEKCPFVVSIHPQSEYGRVVRIVVRVTSLKFVKSMSVQINDMLLHGLMEQDLSLVGYDLGSWDGSNLTASTPMVIMTAGSQQWQVDLTTFQCDPLKVPCPIQQHRSPGHKCQFYRAQGRLLLYGTQAGSLWYHPWFKSVTNCIGYNVAVIHNGQSTYVLWEKWQPLVASPNAYVTWMVKEAINAWPVQLCLTCCNCSRARCKLHMMWTMSKDNAKQRWIICHVDQQQRITTHADREQHVRSTTLEIVSIPNTIWYPANHLFHSDHAIAIDPSHRLLVWTDTLFLRLTCPSVNSTTIETLCLLEFEPFCHRRSDPLQFHTLASITVPQHVEALVPCVGDWHWAQIENQIVNLQTGDVLFHRHQTVWPKHYYPLECLVAL